MIGVMLVAGATSSALLFASFYAWCHIFQQTMNGFIVGDDVDLMPVSDSLATEELTREVYKAA
jgi:hypothetical protein